MSCCGNKRTASAATKTNLATTTSRPFTAARPAADPQQAAVVAARAPVRPLAPAPMTVPVPASAPGTVRLRYLARAGILVRGPRSGTPYRFSENQPVVAVQRADAESMLASGHFRREA